MNNIQKKLLPYKLIIGLCLIIILGSVGVIGVKAANIDITDELVDVMNRVLVVLEDQEGMLGDKVQFDKQVFTQGVWMNQDDGCIYFGQTDRAYGICDVGGIMKYKNLNGTFSGFGSGTPGNEGWLADATNNRMYPSTNASGDFYPLVLGTSATSSPADETTELYVGGGGELVVAGTSHFQGASAMASTLAVTGAGTFSSTLASGALTVTGAVTISTTLTVDGATTQTGALTVAGVTTTNGGLLSKDLDAIGATAMSIGSTTATSIIIADAGVDTTIEGGLTVDQTTTLTGVLTMTGAINGTGTWTNTGNILGANLTASGDFTAGGSLYVINSGDNVGVGSSTPFYRLSVVDTSAQLALAYDSNDVATFNVDTNGDLTIDVTGGDILTPDALSVSTSTVSAYALDVYGDVRFGEKGSASAFLIDTGTQVASFGGALTVSGNTEIDGGTFIFNNSSADVDFRFEGNGAEYLLFGDAGNDRIGISTSTPAYPLDVNGDFRVGEETADTAIFVDATNQRFGIATSSPFADLSIGTDGDATSTIAMNRFCMYAEDQEGKAYYITLNMAAANAAAGIFATSSVSCID